MSTTLEIYRDLMRSAAPTNGAPRILEVVRLWHEEVLDLGHYPHGRSPSLTVDELPTFTWEGLDATCTMHEKWNGTIDLGDERLTLAEAIARGAATNRGGGYHAFTLSDDRLVAVDLGTNAFVARMVEPEQRLRSPLRIDAPFAGVMSFVGMLFFVAAALVLTAPPLPESEMMDPPNRMTDTILVRPPPPIPTVTRTERPADPSPQRSKAASAKRSLEKRQLDRQVAQTAGILGPLAEIEASMDEGLARAIGAAQGLHGTFALPLFSGPWGDGRGPLGGGGIDRIGDVGTKGGPGYGSDGGNFGPKRVGDIGISDDPIVVRGSLGRAEIDAVIKRHLSSIRYCYERQLSRSPDLAGKVAVKFVISKTGGVSKASIASSSVGDPALESCLQTRFLHMQFPEPKGGGIVLVTYPFLFAPG